MSCGASLETNAHSSVFCSLVFLRFLSVLFTLHLRCGFVNAYLITNCLFSGVCSIEFNYWFWPLISYGLFCWSKTTNNSYWLSVVFDFRPKLVQKFQTERQYLSKQLRTINHPWKIWGAFFTCYWSVRDTLQCYSYLNSSHLVITPLMSCAWWLLAGLWENFWLLE